METTKMYGVEYKTDSSSTYEIFENYEDALAFAKSNENTMYLFTADFNNDRIYLDGKNWNYDDFADTFINQEIIEVMKDQFEILKEIHNCGYNVCTCGNCGDVVLLEIKEPITTGIVCPHCECKADYCDFPDLYSEAYNRTIFKN